MTMLPNKPGIAGGHYDKDGHWVRTKFCFLPCPPERCDCMPPIETITLRPQAPLRASDHPADDTQ